MIVAVCDNNKKSRTDLCRIIETGLQLKGILYEISRYDSGESLLQGASQKVPQIVFLDMELPGVNGIETAIEFRKTYKNTVIIFVTTHSDFKFQGYEVRTCYCIRKPYIQVKIKEILYKALAELAHFEEQYYLIEQKGNTVRVPLKEIKYFKSEARNVEVVCCERTERFYGKLTKIEEKLPDYFIRTHSRYIVNLNYVSQLDKNSFLCGLEVLPVGNIYKKELAAAFAQMVLTTL